MNVQELFEEFPSPVGADTVQIYNGKTYDQLIRTFMTRPNIIHTCANGGSVTEGGGNVLEGRRYYRKFMQYIAKNYGIQFIQSSARYSDQNKVINDALSTIRGSYGPYCLVSVNDMGQLSLLEIEHSSELYRINKHTPST